MSIVKSVYDRLPLPKFLRDNIRKKRTLPTWYAHRGQVRNWLSGYVRFSSLVFDLLRRCRAGKTTPTEIRIEYTGGFSIIFPLEHYEKKPFMFWSLSYDYFHRLNREMNGEDFSFPEEAVIVDVGANVGTFCLPFLAESPKHRVLALEPAPGNVACLRRSAQCNGYDAGRLDIEHAAVAAKEGSVSFDLGFSDTTGAMVGAGFMPSAQDTSLIEVTATQLETAMQRHGITHCDMLKMDCEGGEYEILETLPDAVWDRIAAIYIEIHPVGGRDPSQLQKLIEAHGFAGKGKLRDDGCAEVIYRRIKAASG